MLRKDRELARTIAKMEAIARENEGVDDRLAYQRRGGALYKLGNIRARQGRLEEAARLHDEAASTWWNAEPLKGLAVMAWQRKASDLFALWRVEEALEAFEHVIAVDGEFPCFAQFPDLFPLGLSQWLFLVEETGDWDRLYRAGEAAIARIEEIDRAEPIDGLEPMDPIRTCEVLAHAHIAMGTAQRAREQSENALNEFQQAIDLCSVDGLGSCETLSRALLRRASLLDELGMTQLASETYVALLNRFASVPDAWARIVVGEATDWLSAEPR